MQAVREVGKVGVFSARAAVGVGRTDRRSEWVVSNVPPPRADRIQLTNTLPPTIARDAFGNALGGVRTPFLDVPTATYSPTDTVAHVSLFSGFCILYGYNVPFSGSTLHSLYRNHGDYVSQVVHESDDLVNEGFWLRPDAQTDYERGGMIR